MRVSKTTKEKTRKTILETARKLFIENGFDETKTRDIARKAQIAVGTLFNYFASKESLGMEIVAEALEGARGDFEERRRGGESLEEELFLYVMTTLHRLAPHREYLPAVLESSLSPFTATGASEAGERVRTEHLEDIAGILGNHAATDQPSFIAIHLYWTLYLGVLAYWAQDRSTNQEDTLVLLDQSMRLFVASLEANQSKTEVHHGD